MGVFSSAFRNKKEGQSALITPAISQVYLTQNTEYARAAYFGVICSELLHQFE